jgi:hypothetical protein
MNMASLSIAILCAVKRLKRVKPGWDRVCSLVRDFPRVPLSPLFHEGAQILRKKKTHMAPGEEPESGTHGDSVEMRALLDYTSVFVRPFELNCEDRTGEYE